MERPGPLVAGDGPIYRVTETLQASERTLVYRGIRTSDEHPVMLRVLGPRHALPKDVERLEHERRIARLLDGSRTLRPLALDRVQGLPALVFEDFGGQPLALLLRGPMEIGRFLKLAVPICAAVSEVHQWHVIHKDLQPGNIIVNELTGQVKITDFGIASVLPQEHQTARNPALIEGTLAYMSPEQTGRMNRAVDYRTDLYSLGVTFFEMLTGRLPFAANDPLEWVHCHVARQPPDPSQLVPTVPPVIAQIVLRLMAKAAERRYQSAVGLQHDLERCRDEWARSGHQSGQIASFDLARRDAADRLSFPQKLYGREAQTTELLQAFDRVARSQSSELVLVSGAAGIGKSSLVHELHGPVMRARGLFLEGKFDPHQRHVPYATLVQAFRELMLDILTESDDRVAEWRRRLLGALGGNGRLIIEVIPQLALIIGPQPPVPPLAPTDAQHRFALVMRQFIATFPAPDRPVVLFLDDLQWADRATLTLLEQLAAAPETRSLLLVGAYRDNEVDPTHPVTRIIADLQSAGISMREILLPALSRAQVRDLVADIFGGQHSGTAELGTIVAERTAGNPFFALQFLSALFQEKLIRRDPDSGEWQWESARIAARSTTSNVVDFMVQRLSLLSAPTRELVSLAACLGRMSNLPLLAEVCQRQVDQIDDSLMEAARQGVLTRVGESYRFAHDRVRQAAYLLIPEERRAATHLLLGRALLARTPLASQQDSVFEMVPHLNLGAHLISDPVEKKRLAELNLLAGRKAKGANAQAAAVFHLSLGLDLLGPGAWESHYQLAYSLELTLAEAELLCGELDSALARAWQVAARAREPREKVPAFLLARDAAIGQGDAQEAVARELEALALFGITIPRSPGPADVEAARVRVHQALGGRPIEAIADLPPLNDPDLEAAFMMTSSASFTDRDLYLVIAARMVSLSIERGNAEGSVFWYGCYGYILAGLGELQDGQRFARAAYVLREKRAFPTTKGQSHFFLSLTSFWTEPLSEVQAQTDATLDAWSGGGPQTGVALALVNKVYGLLTSGAPLDKVAQEIDPTLAFLRKMRFRDNADMCLLLAQFVKALRGGTVDLSSLSDREPAGSFDQESFAEALTERIWARPICCYWLLRLRLEYLAGNHREALEAARKARAAGWSVVGNMPARDLALYHALALAGAFEEGSPAEREQRLLALTDYQAQFRRWAESNPHSFGHQHALLAAEIARITGRHYEAAELYQESMRLAAQGGFVQDEALAYELGACLREMQGLQPIADLYRREARALYQRWGALEKVRRLDQRYPHVAMASNLSAPAVVISSAEQIDLISVIKASQAISREVIFERLLRKLMEVVLAQSGATRGLLLTPTDGTLRLQAEARVRGGDTETIMAAADLAAGLPSELPEMIIRLTWRTGETVVLDSAAAERRFAEDEYIRRRRPQSVLCLPILRQAETIGVLYLENNAVSGAFTSDRLTVLGVLAGQAAISLENSQLFSKLTAEIDERKRAENAVRFLADAGAALAESLDYQATLAQVTRLAVAWSADWCLIDVLDESGTAQRVACAHRDPEKEKMLRSIRDLQAQKGPPRYTAEVIRDGAPAFVAQEVSDALLAEYVDAPELAEQIKEMGAASFMVLPLRARGRTVGALTLGTAHADRRYAPADVAMAEELARRAAVAIDNAGLYRQAHDAIRLRDEFLSIASHEFKAPIASLHLTVQTLASDLVEISPEILRSSMQTLDRQTTRLSRLVDELLNVTRLDAGQLHMFLEPLDLRAVIQDTADRLVDDFQRAKSPLVLRLSGPVMGKWDRIRLEQVLTNLLLNAAKFGRGKSIEVDLDEVQGRARIRVSDHGIGIAPEEQSRVFDRFARGVSASHYGGFGLGLYIASQIVRAMNGSIAVESAPGQGATFTVELPKDGSGRTGDSGQIAGGRD